MALPIHSICRLVKSEDLNHHGTLFAGKTAMWVVESGFIAAAALTHPENIVCINVHGMLFKKPVRNGHIVRLDSKVVLASKTRLVSYVKMVDNAANVVYMDAFLSFVHVDLQGKAKPHGIVLEYTTEEDTALLEKAKTLK